MYDIVDSTNDISAASVYACDLSCDDAWEIIESPCYWSALAAYQEKLVLIGGIESSTDKMSKSSGCFRVRRELSLLGAQVFLI